MDWFAYVDIYCERTAPGFWNEPFNALSNAVFPLAALWAWAVSRRDGVRDPLIRALIVLAALIGVGSFLFHTFANHLSELADTLPIWGFVALYIYTAIGRMGSRPPPAWVAGLLGAGFLGIAWMAATEATPAPDAAPDPLNGSGQYLPAVVALGVFTALSWARRHPARGWIAGAAGAFALALAFRAVDLRVCASFPTGTHFLWHGFNGLMVALLLQALLRTAGPLSPAAPPAAPAR